MRPWAQFVIPITNEKELKGSSMKGKIVKIGLSLALGVTLSLAVAACGGGSAETSSDHSAVTAHGRMLAIGSGEPQALLGEEGDICLVAETGLLYRKSSNGWAEAAYESYSAENDIFTVNYSDGAVGTYEMTVLPSECKHENLSDPVTVYDPKCVIPGIGVCYCAECGEAFPTILPASGEHRYADGGYSCLDCGETNYFKDAELGGRGDTLSNSALYSVEGKYVIQKESHQTTDFGETGGKVVIPGNIDGKEVVIGEMAFGSENKEANTTITSLVIEEGVKVIGQRAFQNCTALESVTLPESLTILGGDPKDGSYTTGYLKIFAGCTSLREVHLGSKVTVIGNQAFLDCSSLTSIDLPQSLKEIHYGAFQGSGLTNVEIPESVDKIENLAFSDCSKLTSFQFGKDTIKGKVGSTVINGISSSLFQDCVSLAHITLPEGIEEIGSSAFLGCSALAEIEIPANVTTIGDKAFQNCNLIASLTFGEGSKLKSIGSNAFYCGGNYKPRNEELQTVILPEGLETVGNNAFTYCISLEWIVIPSTLQSFGGSSVFNHCDSLQLFYSGDSAAWSNVKNANNVAKTVVYFSAEQQTGCWHWIDGVPQIWE